MLPQLSFVVSVGIGVGTAIACTSRSWCSPITAVSLGLVVGLAALGWLRFHVTRPHNGLGDPPPRRCDARLLLSAQELSAALRRGDYTSAELVEVFIQHIRSVNPHLNAMVHNRFAAARKEALAADAKLAKARAAGELDSLGWLTGVPISVKECFAVSGCPNTSGLPNRVGVRPTADAPAVDMLREAGAIVLGVTNTSELCMWMESSNSVYGTTHNAYDVRRVVGGSSGGEGCAVSALFAPVGLGSDVGGSIRMPAYFNGVFGFKPSSRLIPNRGQHPSGKSQGHFMLSTGPITRRARDLYPMAITLSSRGFLEDPKVLPPCPPLRDPSKVDVSKLTVYCVEDLGIPLVPVARQQRHAVRLVGEAMEKRFGCKVKYLNLSNKTDAAVPAGWELFRQSFPLWTTPMTFNGERRFTDFMSEGYPGGLPLGTEALRLLLSGVGPHTLPALGLCLLEKTTALTPQSHIDHHRKMATQLKESLTRTLADDAVLITPTYPRKVLKHNKPFLHPISWIYTAIFNALEVPSTAVPVWASDDQLCPLGVQVVARWSRDDLTLAVAEALDRETPICGYRPPRWVLPAEEEAAKSH